MIRLDRGAAIRFSVHMLALGVSLTAAVPMFRYGLGNIIRYNPSVQSVLFESEAQQIFNDDVPSILVTRWVRANLTEADAALVFRTSDIGYYTHGRLRRIFSDLDPELLGVFTANSAHQIALILKRLDIEYVITPAYSMPSVYNSEMSTLLADPRYAQLVYDRGAKVFRLMPLESESEQTIDWIANWQFNGDLIRNEQWSYWDSRSRFLQTEFLESMGELSIETDPHLDFFRSPDTTSSYLYSGRGVIEESPASSFSSIDLDNSRNYVVQLIGAGRGEIDISLAQYSPTGEFLRRKFIWGGIFNGEVERIATGAFRLDPDAADARIAIRIREDGELVPRTIKLGATPVAQTATDMPLDGWSVTMKDREEGIAHRARWGSRGRSMFLEQETSQPITLHSPQLQLGESHTGFCVQLSGRGHLLVEAELQTGCLQDSCSTFTTSTQKLLLRSTPSQVVMDLPAMDWSVGSSTANPMMSRETKYVRLLFHLTSDYQYSGTEHVLGRVNIDHISHSEADRMCSSTNLM